MKPFVIGSTQFNKLYAQSTCFQVISMTADAGETSLTETLTQWLNANEQRVIAALEDLFDDMDADYDDDEEDDEWDESHTTNDLDYLSPTQPL